MSTITDPTPPLFKMLRYITSLMNDTSAERLSDIELYQIGYNLSIYMVELHGRKLYPRIGNYDEKGVDFNVHFGYNRASFVMDWVRILKTTKAKTERVELAMSGPCVLSERTENNIPLDILNLFKDMQRTEEGV